MDCPICARLKQAYEAVLSEYNEARSSAVYQFSTKLAAQKNVDMERARYELEEHRAQCATAADPSLLPQREASTRSKQLAA